MERFTCELKQFIESVKWTYAKNIPDWPHYYIIRAKVDEILFVKLVKHIRLYGYQGAFYKMIYTYFEEEGLIYWTMGNPVDVTTIINRAKKCKGEVHRDAFFDNPRLQCDNNSITLRF